MKAVLIAILFFTGEPQGQYDPITFESMDACVEAYEGDIKERLDDAGEDVKVYCITKQEVRTLR